MLFRHIPTVAFLLTFWNTESHRLHFHRHVHLQGDPALQGRPGIQYHQCLCQGRVSCQIPPSSPCISLRYGMTDLWICFLQYPVLCHRLNCQPARDGVLPPARGRDAGCLRILGTLLVFSDVLPVSGGVAISYLCIWLTLALCLATMLSVWSFPSEPSNRRMETEEAVTDVA